MCNIIEQALLKPDGQYIIEQALLKPDGQYPEILKLLDTWPLYSLKGLKAVCFDGLN